MLSIRNFIVKNGGYVTLAIYAVIWCAGLLWFSGCTTIPHVFDRGDVPVQQFNKDAAACEMAGEEHRSVDIALWGFPASFDRIYDTCMRSKGYARKT